MASSTNVPAINDEKTRPQFGNRTLNENQNVFQHNAWDNVVWDEEKQNLARQKVFENSSTFVSSEDSEKYEKQASVYWDKFYDIHQNRFFKDRHWLFTEFPELSGDKDAERDLKIMEIGCGVGNSVFPILKYDKNPNLFVYACDFSSNAIEIFKQNPDYDESRCKAFVLDVTQENWNLPFPPESLDAVLMIFVLSSINPEKTKRVVDQIYKYLKPGGSIFFRDYGRYDLAQLRFKKGRCLSDNFYARGDGTRVYFFTQDEIREAFLGSNFVEDQNIIDKRLQVNRGKQLTMYRVWIQAKYRKL